MDTPYIDYTEQMGGSVELNHVVELQCSTTDCDIYYTVDGSSPYPWNKSSKVSVEYYYASTLFELQKHCIGVVGLKELPVYQMKVYHIFFSLSVS